MAVLPKEERHISFVPEESLEFDGKERILGFGASEAIGEESENQPILINYKNLEAYQRIHPGALVVLEIEDKDKLECRKDLKKYYQRAITITYFMLDDGTDKFSRK